MTERSDVRTSFGCTRWCEKDTTRRPEGVANVGTPSRLDPGKNHLRSHFGVKIISCQTIETNVYVAQSVGCGQDKDRPLSPVGHT
ncbi:hypothetical protein QE152_g6540 [Popillia japonica]|uniref:Uncharacterized protein n=1 Tax=Popillia japonica TaxID=7064 RepID=A0AAW1MK46_POPJA